MTTVIVKGATFECLEKNVPDHVPLTSVAGCWAEPAADVASLLWAPASLGAQKKPVPIRVISSNHEET
jgi:hypothetical protein